MNDPLIEMLSCVTDCRREQAKRYGLANILLFCILGFLCGAKSYKTLSSFIVLLHRGAFCAARGHFPIENEARPRSVDPVADHRPG
jgi:hypothetical protein